MDDQPTFPPLLKGEIVPKGADPFAKGCAAAIAGVDAGTVFWSADTEMMDAALVLAPEEPLRDAMAMVLAVANGLGDAIGALGPPETAVTWDWPDTLRINRAYAGRFRAEASTRDPYAVPDWLVIGASVQIEGHPPGAGVEPGDRPDLTTLVEEGCLGLDRTKLVESWSRHTLSWINRWSEDGFRPLHDAWVGRVEHRGEEVRKILRAPENSGLFLGLDEHGGMILQPEGAPTRIIPLTDMLDRQVGWPVPRMAELETGQPV
jgi:BirA family biotin operon repressor/biotin-[acetyl-CoA-carboxylase] ligase